MAKISLQDLIERFHLSKDQLDKEVSDEHLREASRIIDDHKTLEPALGLLIKRWLQSVLTWANMRSKSGNIEENGRQAQVCLEGHIYRKLIDALLKCGRADHDQDVYELLSKSEFLWSYWYRHETIQLLLLQLQMYLLNRNKVWRSIDKWNLTLTLSAV